MTCGGHCRFGSGGPLFYVPAAHEEAKSGLEHVLDSLFFNIVNALLSCFCMCVDVSFVQPQVQIEQQFGLFFMGLPRTAVAQN